LGGGGDEKLKEGNRLERRDGGTRGEREKRKKNGEEKGKSTVGKPY